MKNILARGEKVKHLKKYILTAAFLLTTLSANNDKLFFGPCNAFSKNMKFDCYHDFAEM